MAEERLSKGQLVVELNQHDVFLGRGKNAIFRPGNVKFRQLAAACETQLIGKPQTKTALAIEIIAKIETNGGRFLRPVTAADKTGEIIGAWEIVGHDVALLKTKQAIRDASSSRSRKSKRRKERQPTGIPNHLSGVCKSQPSLRHRPVFLTIFAASPYRPPNSLLQHVVSKHHPVVPYAGFHPSQGIFCSSTSSFDPAFSMTTSHFPFPALASGNIYENPLMTPMQYQLPSTNISPSVATFGSHLSGPLAQALFLQAQAATCSPYPVGSACMPPQELPQGRAAETGNSNPHTRMQANPAVSVDHTLEPALLPPFTSMMSVANHTAGDAEITVNGPFRAASLLTHPSTQAAYDYKTTTSPPGATQSCYEQVDNL